MRATNINLKAYLKYSRLLAVMLICLFAHSTLGQTIAPSMKWYLQSAMSTWPSTQTDTLVEPRYNDFLSNSNLSKDRQMLGYVRVGFDKDVHLRYVEHRKYVVSVLINYHQLTSTGPNVFDSTSSSVSVMKDFIIDLDPDNENPYNESAIFFMKDAYKVTATITNIAVFDSVGTDLTSGLTIPADLPSSLYIEATFDAEQYQSFSPNLPPTGLTVNYIDVAGVVQCGGYTNSPGYKNSIVFTWDATTNGETDVELEWAYVNDYSPNAADDYTDMVSYSSLEVRFSNNSSRLRIPAGQSEFVIPAMYDRGWIVARIRGVGRDWTDLNHEVRTKWSFHQNFNHSSPIDSLPRCYIYASGDQINWISSATYVEEGKNKFVVSYADGSSRVRQQVTLSSTDTIALATETIYDHQGRAAVQTLPAPVLEYNSGNDDYGNHIQYYTNLNRDGSNNKYGRNNFDLDPVGLACQTTAAPFTDGIGSSPNTVFAGAGRYYSSSNELLNINYAQSFVPMSNGYPFTVTQFTPDNTGRIAAQSGVGADHSIGSGHETKYFYATPGQVELDRLFGTDVGYRNFYQKNMVIDANGQASVSYVDMAGRTIATALAGDVPANLQYLKDSTGASVPANAAILVTEDLIGQTSEYPLGINTTISADSMSTIINYGFVVSSPQAYSFDYLMQAGSYTDTCITDICLYCKYRLEISVKDRCGNEMLDGGMYTDTIGGYELDTICDNDTLSVGTDVDLVTGILPVGEYTVTKTLTILEDILDEYVEVYLRNSSCLLELNDFYFPPDTSGCNMTCEICQTRLDSMGTLNEYIADQSGGQPLSGTDSLTLTNYYNSIVQQCQTLCEPPSSDNCGTLFQMMMADMSPGGQYAEFRPDSLYPDTLRPYGPLSILRDSINSTVFCRLPIRNQAQFTSNVDPNLDFTTSTGDLVATWRRPKFYIGNGQFAAEYRDEFGNRPKVYLTYDGTNYSPGVHHPSEVVYVAADDVYYTYPENLQNLADFVAIFKPSFAQSLIVYHPEFFAYQWCEERVYTDTTQTLIGVSRTFNSNQFDYYLRHMTLDSAQVAFGTNLNIKAYDPFYSTNPDVTTMFDAFSNNILDISGYTFNIYESAIIAVHLTGNYSNVPAVIDAYISAYPACCDGDMITTDEEWKRVVEFYLSAKAKASQKLTFNHIINNPYFAQLWCIGGNIPVIPNIYLHNFANPCAIDSWWMYHDKTPRFFNFIENQNEALGVGDGVDTSDPDELEAVANHKYWQKTGKCPLARDVEAFISSLVGQDVLTTPTPVDLTTRPYLSNALYTLFDGASTAPIYLPTVATNNLVLTWTPPIPAGCDMPLTLSIPPGSPPTLTLDNITTAFDMHHIVWNSAAGYSTFKIRVYDSAGELHDIDGKICINLEECNTFITECAPTDQATSLLHLMSALGMQDSLDQASMSLENYEPILGDEFNTLLGAGPYTWAYDSGTPSFTISGSGPSITINITSSTGGINYSNPLWFKNIYSATGGVSTSTGSTNVFRMDYVQPTPPDADLYFNPSAITPTGYIEGEIVYYAGTDSVYLPAVDCQEPLSVECNSPANQNLEELKDLLDLTITALQLNEDAYDSTSCLSNLVLQSTGNPPNFADIADILEVIPDESQNFDGLNTYHFTAQVEMDNGLTDLLIGQYCHPLRSCERNCNSYCVPEDSVTLSFHIDEEWGDSSDIVLAFFLWDPVTDTFPSCFNINPMFYTLNDGDTTYSINEHAQLWVDSINNNTPYVHAEYDNRTVSITIPTSYLSSDCNCASNREIIMGYAGNFEFNPETFSVHTRFVVHYASDNISCCQEPDNGPCIPSDSISLSYTIDTTGITIADSLLLHFFNLNEGCAQAGMDASSFVYFDTTLDASLLDYIDRWVDSTNSAPGGVVEASLFGNVVTLTFPTSILTGPCVCGSNMYMPAYWLQPQYDPVNLCNCDYDTLALAGYDYISCCVPDMDTITAPCVLLLDSLMDEYHEALDTLADAYQDMFDDWLEACADTSLASCDSMLQDIYDWYTEHKAEIDTFYLHIIWDIQDTCDVWEPIDSLNFVKCNETIIPFPPGPPLKNPCGDDMVNLAWANAQYDYDAYIARERLRIKRLLRNHCLIDAGFHEIFTMTDSLREYHYTLYYYDQAGNLYRTVPPRAVTPIDDVTTLGYIVSSRNSGGSAILPEHADPTEYAYNYVTEYRFNSLNQPIEQKTPDGGASAFWYDNLGRLIYSQNAKQAFHGTPSFNTYSYTKFDAQGRIIEVGELDNDSLRLNQDIAGDADGDTLALWEGRNINNRQMTRTYYDYNPMFGGLGSSENARKRVAMTVYMERIGGALFGDMIKSLTIYSYDILGNVKRLAQLNTDMPYQTDIFENFKVIHYYYDLASGKVNSVAYNPYGKDRYFHKYKYDADNRLTHAYTWEGSDVPALDLANKDWNAPVMPISYFEHVLPFDEDARYFYYHHGPLARTEIGDLKVQGVDFMYTLQGWIKGVNSTILSDSLDPGYDSDWTVSGNPNRYVARDAYSFSLNYFLHDYEAINSSRDLFRATPDITNGFGSTFSYLYNGNISSMVTTLKQPGNNTDIFPQGMVYKYDQLNRLIEATAYDSLNRVGNAWYAEPPNVDYYNRFSYDANGNILTQLRRGDAVNGINMDSLDYHYYPGTNQLEYVSDDPTYSANYYDDIDDQGSGNYVYDPIGNLYSDVQGGIDSIRWNVYGKIKAVYGGIIVDSLKFTYSADGQRITKNNSAFSTYYVRDAAGNVMATYYGSNSDSTLYLHEQYMYGSSRLGTQFRNINMFEDEPADTLYDTSEMAYKVRGKKRYELTNHLGNVLSIVWDRRQEIGTADTVDYYEADVYAMNDYYAFGSPMQGRRLENGVTLLERYKYGFNGKEKDHELYGLDNAYDFGARIYDSRLGRWLSVDKLEACYPAFSPYNYVMNKPIKFVDKDGRVIWDPDKKQEVIVSYSTSENGTVTATYKLKDGGEVSDFFNTNSKPTLDILVSSEVGRDIVAGYSSISTKVVFNPNDERIVKSNASNSTYVPEPDPNGTNGTPLYNPDGLYAQVTIGIKEKEIKDNIKKTDVTYDERVTVTLGVELDHISTKEQVINDMANSDLQIKYAGTQNQKELKELQAVNKKAYEPLLNKAVQRGYQYRLEKNLPMSNTILDPIEKLNKNGWGIEYSKDTEVIRQKVKDIKPVKPSNK